MTHRQLNRRHVITASASAALVLSVFPKALAVGLPRGHEKPTLRSLDLQEAEAVAVTAIDDNQLIVRLLPRCDGCVDGRQNKSVGVHTSGAHYGLLARLFAWRRSTKTSGTIPDETLFTAFIAAIGGIQNLRVHTECGYIAALHEKPEAFGVTREDIAAIDSFVDRSGVPSYEVSGPHREQAIFRILHLGAIGEHGEGAVMCETSALVSNREVRIFVYQETLVEAVRVRRIAQALYDCSPHVRGNTTFTEVYDALCAIEDRHAKVIFLQLAPHLRNAVYDIVIGQDGRIQKVLPSEWLNA